MSSYYNTGTVSVTNGATAVAGSGTSWAQTVYPGDMFVGPDGRSYTVASIEGDTALTLVRAYAGSTEAGAAYEVLFTEGRNVSAAATLTELMSRVGGMLDGAGAGRFPNGDAATPGVRSGEFPGSGVYFGDQLLGLTSGDTAIELAADAMKVSLGGAEHVRILSDGKVGLGKSNPSDKLWVEADEGEGVSIGGYTPYGGNPNRHLILTTNDNAVNNGKAHEWQLASESNPAGTEHDFTWRRSLRGGASLEEAMRLAGNGRLGLGTNAPGADLEVSRDTGSTLRLTGTKNGTWAGETLASLEFYGQDESGSGPGVRSAIRSIPRDEYGVAFHLVFEQGGNERMRLNSDGKLGIGTADPFSHLTIRDGVPSITLSQGSTTNAEGGHLAFAAGSIDNDTRARITLDESSNGLAFDVRNVGEDAWQRAMFIEKVTGGIRFRPGDQEMARVDDEGFKVGNSFSSGTLANTFSSTGFSASEDGLVEIARENNKILILNRLSGGGDVQDFRYNGDVKGSISISGSATSYNTSSDYRLKEVHGDVSSAWGRVKSLPVYEGHFHTDPDQIVDFFLAHEAQVQIPYAVTGEKDGEEMQMVDYSKAVPLLTAALKEAMGRIEALEEQLEASA